MTTPSTELYVRDADFRYHCQLCGKYCPCNSSRFNHAKRHIQEGLVVMTGDGYGPTGSGRTYRIVTPSTETRFTQWYNHDGIICDSLSNLVCRVERKRDADAICALPDLYAALEGLLKASMVPNLEELPEARKAARASLARARWEQ